MAGFCIHIADTAKLDVIARPAGGRIEFDDLIAPQTGGRGHRMAGHHVEAGVRFEPRDEEGPGAVQRKRPAECLVDA